MDSSHRTSKPASKFTKTFQKMIHLKSSSRNRPSTHPGFCLLIPQEKLRCFESRQFEDEEADEAKEESRKRAAMEAFVAKLFATVSALKAAYAELQMAQFPYDDDGVQLADQSVVNELKALSELKHGFLKQKIDFSPPHVTLMLAEIQEQQALMRTYEVTMRKLRKQTESKEAKIMNLRQQLQEISEENKWLERKMNASGCFSILNSVCFSDVNSNDFVLVLQYYLRSVRNFVKFLIREMVKAGWDVEAATSAVQSGIGFSKRDHRAFAFESFVCREMLAGFDHPAFSPVQNDESDGQFLPDEIHQRRIFFFEQFRQLRTAGAAQFLRQSPNSPFGKFMRSKYLSMVHPKMEFSFSGNLNQRKMVKSYEFPETDFFKAFAEMGRRVWLLHCLAFSFKREVSIFQLRRGSRFSELYMESVTDVITAGGAVELRVAFTVVPGFKVGQTVVQSQVYLLPASLPATS